MDARIDLLKNLLTKKRWKTVEATLYSTERDLLDYLVGKTQTCVMPYDALSECQDTLEKIGLILPNGAITSVGTMYLEGVGQLESKSEPSQSIEPAHTIEQELSNSPSVQSDCLTEAEKADEGSEPVPPRVRKLNTLRMLRKWGELWNQLRNKEKNLILCLSNIDNPNVTPRAHEVEAGVLSVMTLTGLVAVCGENLYLTRAGVTFACHRAVAASKIPVPGVDQPVPVDCLIEAASVVRGERQESYGPAERNLARIAELWSSYLDHPITSRNVAVMMILLKAARDAHKSKHDNMVDICGYAYLADILDKDTSLK